MTHQIQALCRRANEAAYQVYNSLPTETVQKTKEIAAQILSLAVVFRIFKAPKWKGAFIASTTSVSVFNAASHIQQCIASSELPNVIKETLCIMKDTIVATVGVYLFSSSPLRNLIKIAFSLTISSWAINQLFQRTILKEPTEELEINFNLADAIIYHNESIKKTPFAEPITLFEAQLLQKAVNRGGSFSYEDLGQLFLQCGAPILKDALLTPIAASYITKYGFKIATNQIPFLQQILSKKSIVILTIVACIQFAGKRADLNEILENYQILEQSQKLDQVLLELRKRSKAK